MTVEQLGVAAFAVSVAMIGLAGVLFWLAHEIDRAMSWPAPAPRRWFR